MHPDIQQNVDSPKSDWIETERTNQSIIIVVIIVVIMQPKPSKSTLNNTLAGSHA